MTGDIRTVVVATEPGKGFPSCRWLLPWGGTTLLGHVLTNVRAWGLGEGLLILGEHADEVVDRVDFSGFSAIIDPEWSEGSAASLRTGFDLLQRETETTAALVVSAALPSLPTGVVNVLLAAAEDSDRPAIVPKYRYAIGEPVLLVRWLWPQLVGVERTASLANALEAHPDWIEEVWIDQLPPVRVDTPEAFSRIAPRR